jgi:hypothetical protein
MAADDNGSQDRAAYYDREVRERAARDSGDSGVAMMAAAQMAAAEEAHHWDVPSVKSQFGKNAGKRGTINILRKIVRTNTRPNKHAYHIRLINLNLDISVLTGRC